MVAQKSLNGKGDDRVGTIKKIRWFRGGFEKKVRLRLNAGHSYIQL